MRFRGQGKAEPGLLTAQRNGKTVWPASRFKQMVRGKYKLRILWRLQNDWRRYSAVKKGLLTGSVDSVEIAPRALSRELKTEGCRIAARLPTLRASP